MNTKIQIGTMFLAFGCYIMFSSFSGGRDNTTTCSTCHGGGTGGGAVTLFAAEECVEPGGIIELTLCVEDADALMAGFAVSASMGMFTPSAGTRNGTGDTGHLTHNTPQMMSGGFSCWTFDYTAPSFATTVMFTLRGNSVNGNGGTSGDFAYTGTEMLEVKIPLPVSMTDFSIENDRNKAVVLKWKTESETNNDYFVIERSMDGRAYEALIELNGKGTAAIGASYSFTDEKPIINRPLYYRIQQVDFDGTATYSPIETIQLNLLDVHIEKIYPSLVDLGESVNVDYILPTETNVEYAIISSNGKVVDSRNIDGLSGRNSLAIDMTRITQKGLYYLVIGTELAKTEAMPFVVK